MTNPAAELPPKPSVWRERETFVSFAQNWEDVVLWRALQHVEHGTYVDVGAADPVLDSVTKALYERGWSGVNVEPVEELHHRLVEDRPRDVNVRAAAGSTNGEMILHQFDGTGLSTLVDHVAHETGAGRAGQEIRVEIRTLDDILASSLAPGQPVHLLKIDVEGFEIEVLKGIDLATTRPWVVVVEATAPSSTEPTHDQWEHLLLGSGYVMTLFDGLNRFYVASEHPELVPAMSRPVCVFDHPYVSARHAADVAELVVKQELLEGASRELTSKQEALESLVDSVDRRAAEISAQAAEISAQAAEISAQAAEISALHGELDRVLGSRSWRLTRPFRDGVRWFSSRRH